MVKEQETRKIVKLLKDHGWRPGRTVGSHTKWFSPDGSKKVSVPDGHKTISPGVVRQINEALGLD